MSGSEVFDATVFAAGYWASGGIDELGVWSGGVAGTSGATLTGTLTAAGDLATATIGGQTLTLRAYSDIAGGVLFTTTDYATFYAFLSVPFDAAVQYALSYTVAGNSGLACFAAGTRIATARGERPVEALRAGMAVRTLRRGLVPVRWLGRRRIAPEGAGSWPVRIAAHAFAPGRPRRDLLLSPDHAVFAGGGLIPVRCLVNGATIATLPLAAVEYWHVELPAHDLLRAEGLPAESFLDTGNRGSFDNAGRVPGGNSPARSLRIWARHGCAPLLLTRAAQAPVRRHLLARAAVLGHRRTDDPGLAVFACGTALPLQRAGMVWRATVPAGARRLLIRSRSAVPAELLADSDDARRLGIAVTRLTLDGACVPFADRAAGWHRPEPGLHWSTGNAMLLCNTNADAPRLLDIAAAALLRYWDTGPAGLYNAAQPSQIL
jgi:hypothetical protein